MSLRGWSPGLPFASPSASVAEQKAQQPPSRLPRPFPTRQLASARAPAVCCSVGFGVAAPPRRARGWVPLPHSTPTQLLPEARTVPAGVTSLCSDTSSPCESSAPADGRVRDDEPCDHPPHGADHSEPDDGKGQPGGEPQRS